MRKISTAISERELKEKIVKLVERDKEFRYMIMGLLGFKELVDRLARIEEREQDIVEGQLKLNERLARLEKEVLELRKDIKVVEERIARLEKTSIEVKDKIEEIEKLESKNIDELRYIRRITEYTRRDLSALIESIYARQVLEKIINTLGVSRDDILRVERNYIVDGIEIDLFAETPEKNIIVEIKIQPDHHDLEKLSKKKQLIEDKTSKKTIPVLAGVWIGGEIRRLAEDKGILVVEI